MLCPTCRTKCHNFFGAGVLDSRHHRLGTWRRRVCPSGHRFTTYELSTKTMRAFGLPVPARHCDAAMEGM